MKPLTEWDNLRKGYRFGQKTYYSNYHLGLDLICDEGTPIYAPSDGEIVFTSTEEHTPQGGNQVHYATNGHIMRFLHLSSYQGVGRYREGDIIGHTGNTGQSTAAHLHIDISKQAVNIFARENFVDPEKYQWEDEMTEDRWVALALPTYISRWEEGHGRTATKNDMRSIERELRLGYQGTLDLTELLARWAVGQ